MNEIKALSMNEAVKLSVTRNVTCLLRDTA